MITFAKQWLGGYLFTLVYSNAKLNRPAVSFIAKTQLHIGRYYKKHYKKMNWTLLIIAGLFEVAFAVCLGKAKESVGIESTYWYIGFIACLGISMFLLVKVTEQLPIGTAYAVWTGIGAVGTVLIGILIFKEPATFWRLFFITTLIVSVIGLKIVSH